MPAERTTMRHVREVLRLKFVGGVPTREIAPRIGVAASTVRATIKRFQAVGLSWPLPEELTDAALEARLFPCQSFAPAGDVILPANTAQKGMPARS
jgi:transposase-like protein